MNRRQKRNVLIAFVIIVAITILGSISLSHFSKRKIREESYASVISGEVTNKDVANEEATKEGSEETSIPVIDITEVPNLVKEEPSAEPEPVFEEYDISLMAVGDNLCHMGVINTGKQADGTLDYTCLYDGIKPYLEKADIRMINQETIMAGNQLGFSGFPNFNSPTEVGDSLVKVGFNVVLQASNHSADQGVSGIDSCVNFWKQYPEVTMLGIHEPRDTSKSFDENEIHIMTIDGFKFAILNYTYGPNYETVSKEVLSRLDVLCNVSTNGGKMDYTTLNPKVIEDIQKAKALADIVIVAPHWGTEYQTKPSSYQEKFAREIIDAGADVIIGTHPHVTQPMEWITTENGNTGLCFYSLGNYVSTQKTGCSMLEGLAWVNFHVTEDGISVSREGTGMLPLVCHYSFGPVRIKYVYALEDYSEELASKHGIINYGGISFHYEHLRNWCDEIFGDDELTSSQILTY